MANMRKNTLMERAELARAYINGGSAPYQAARQTGFMRVTEMQEAIRALEHKEAEEIERSEISESKSRDLPSVASTRHCAGEWPSTDKAKDENDRFGPKETEPERIPVDDPPKTIYPFLPPGQVAEEPAKRPLYALHTRELSVKRIGSSRPEVQIVLLENRYTLSIPVELLDKLISLLQAAKTLETD